MSHTVYVWTINTRKIPHELIAYIFESIGHWILTHNFFQFFYHSTASTLSHQSQWQNLVREEFGSILQPSSHLATQGPISPNFLIFWLCHHCAWVGSFGVPVGWPHHSWWVSNVPPQFLLNCLGVSALIQLYQIIGPHIQVGLQLEKPLILRINDPRSQKLMPLT